MTAPTRAILLAILLTAPIFSHASPPNSPATAQQIMEQAKAEAAVQHKNILLMFGASWCGNCRLLDRMLADAEVGPIMHQAFVYADVNSGETGRDPRHVNTPGAVDYEKKLGGEKVGYPYIVMLDANGAPLANSVRPSRHGKGENIGYPDAPEEIDWFMEMLSKGAPSLTEQQRDAIRTWLTAHNTEHRKTAAKS